MPPKEFIEVRLCYVDNAGDVYPIAEFPFKVGTAIAEAESELDCGVNLTRAALCSLSVSLENAGRLIRGFKREFDMTIAALIRPIYPKWAHLMTHAKKKRVRLKYLRMAMGYLGGRVEVTA